MNNTFKLVQICLWILAGIFTLSLEKVTKPLYALVWFTLIMALICDLHI